MISFASRTARPGSLLQGPWPLIWGGVALVALNFATLALAGRPWGVTSAFALWGAKTLDALGGDVATWTYWSKQASLAAPLRQDVTTVMDLGLMLGALAAASRQVRAGLESAGALAGRRRHRRPAAGLRLAPGLRLQHRRLLQRHPVGQPACWLWLPAAFLGSALGVRLRPLFGGRGKDAACVELLTRHPLKPL